MIFALTTGVVWVNQIAASVHMTQENGEITIVLNRLPKAL